MRKPSKKRDQLLGRIGLGLCLLATLLGIGLRVICLTHAGALWRDEAASVQLASLPDFGFKERLAHDFTFPAFFPELVRVWSALGLGASDFTLRILGFIIGLGLLATIWLNARLMGFRWPFISLGLLAANLALVRWGDSLRAYGCGSLFIMLALGLIWRLVRAPGGFSFLAASLAAVLSVQTLYHNAFLVLAACVAGWVVCARRRQWKTAALVLGVRTAGRRVLGALRAALGRLRGSHRLQDGIPTGSGMGHPRVRLGVGPGMAALGVVGAGTLRPGSRMGGAARTGEGFTDRLPGFAGVRRFRARCGYCALLYLSPPFRIPTQPWYFLPLMVFAASAMDAALAESCRQFRAWPPVFVAVMVCVPFPAILKLAQYRHTNIDLIAAELHRQAKPGDLILVSPLLPRHHL